LKSTSKSQLILQRILTNGMKKSTKRRNRNLKMTKNSFTSNQVHQDSPSIS